MPLPVAQLVGDCVHGLVEHPAAGGQASDREVAADAGSGDPHTGARPQQPRRSSEQQPRGCRHDGGGTIRFICHCKSNFPGRSDDLKCLSFTNKQKTLKQV